MMNIKAILLSCTCGECGFGLHKQASTKNMYRNAVGIAEHRQLSGKLKQKHISTKQQQESNLHKQFAQSDEIFWNTIQVSNSIRLLFMIHLFRPRSALW